MDRRRAARTALVAGALAAVIAWAPRPSADIRIETHDAADASPRRVQAALDLGLMAVSLLVTWTAPTVR